MQRKLPFNGYRTDKNPCHSSDGKDCPRRKPGCQIGCEDWAKHKQCRAELYKQRAKEADITIGYNEIRKTRGRDKYYGGG